MELAFMCGTLNGIGGLSADENAGGAAVTRRKNLTGRRNSAPLVRRALNQDRITTAGVVVVGTAARESRAQSGAEMAAMARHLAVWAVAIEMPAGVQVEARSPHAVGYALNPIVANCPAFHRREHVRPGPRKQRQTAGDQNDQYAQVGAKCVARPRSMTLRLRRTRLVPL